MSVLAALARPFKRDLIRIIGPREAELAAGVRTPADAKYRVQRIQEHLATMSDHTTDRVTETVQFLDQWVILEAGSGWIPFPGWDDKPLTRDAHRTREEAIAAVREFGGALRPGRAQSIV